MGGFTKLHQSLLGSTVWDEPHPTRIVWVTMLAMADAKGRVECSVPGLAHMARVTIEECERALDCFLSPDRYSKSKNDEGRRIEAIDGGWRLLNYAKHREARDPDARRTYQANWVKQKRSRVDQMSTNVDRSRPPSTQAEAEEILPSGRSATAGDDLQRDLWALGVEVLKESGLGERTARAFIGGLLKQYAEQTVLDAVRASAGKAEPKQYMLGVLKDKPKRGERAKSGPSLLAGAI